MMIGFSAEVHCLIPFEVYTFACFDRQGYLLILSKMFMFARCTYRGSRSARASAS